MSHIAVDLKVIEVHAPMVARVLEEPVAITLGGLNLLWHRCWSTQQATISRIGLAGIFGIERIDLRIEALIDAGFLTPEGDTFRVRGAEKYLRIREGNSRGGHAAKGNLRKGHKPGPKPGPKPEGEPGTEPEATREGAGGEPGNLPGSIPALTPSTEHRAPNTTTKDAGSATPDPRHRPLIGTLTAAFAELRGSKYPFQQRDAKTVQRLLALAEPVAIDAAWRRALKHQGYPTVSTLQELEKHLARFLGTGPPGNPRGPADVPLWTNDDAGEIHP